MILSTARPAYWPRYFHQHGAGLRRIAGVKYFYRIRARHTGLREIQLRPAGTGALRHHEPAASALRTLPYYCAHWRDHGLVGDGAQFRAYRHACSGCIGRAYRRFGDESRSDVRDCQRTAGGIRGAVRRERGATRTCPGIARKPATAQLRPVAARRRGVREHRRSTAGFKPVARQHLPFQRQHAVAQPDFCQSRETRRGAMAAGGCARASFRTKACVSSMRAHKFGTRRLRGTSCRFSP